MKVRLTLIATALLMLCACAFESESIEVPYRSAGAVGIMPQAMGALVSVNTLDRRTERRDRVSSRKNGYGSETAAIYASNDLAATVTGAIEQELKARGFTIAPGGSPPRVEVELLKIYSDFRTGFFSGDAVADTALLVRVYGPGGNIAFTDHYYGSATTPGITLFIGSNAQPALIAALQDVITKAVRDDRLIQAIISSQPTTRARTS